MKGALNLIRTRAARYSSTIHMDILAVVFFLA